MANQELKFLAKSLSRLKPTEKSLQIIFNPFQRVLALSPHLSAGLAALLKERLTRTHIK